MDYGQLINRAWNISWRHKTLWILGLFASGAPSYGLNWNLGSEDLGKLSLSAAALVPLFIAGGIIGIITLVLHFIMSAGLIDAVNRVTRGGGYRLGESFSSGIDFFWRFLGLGLLTLVTFLAFLVVVALPGVAFFWVDTFVGILSLCLLVPLGLAGMALIFVLYLLSQRVLVARNGPIGGAIREAYLLLKLHIASNAAIFLMYVGLSLLAGIIFLLMLGLVAAPFVAMALTSASGLVVALVIGLPAIIALALVTEGLLGTFLSSLYTLFYFQLVEPSPTRESSLPTQGDMALP